MINRQLQGTVIYPTGCGVSTTCRKLVSLMLEPNTERRADINAVLIHPWLEEQRKMLNQEVNNYQGVVTDHCVYVTQADRSGVLKPVKKRKYSNKDKHSLSKEDNLHEKTYHTSWKSKTETAKGNISPNNLKTSPLDRKIPEIVIASPKRTFSMLKQKWERVASRKSTKWHSFYTGGNLKPGLENVKTNSSLKEKQKHLAPNADSVCSSLERHNVVHGGNNGNGFPSQRNDINIGTKVNTYLHISHSGKEYYSKKNLDIGQTSNSKKVKHTNQQIGEQIPIANFLKQKVSALSMEDITACKKEKTSNVCYTDKDAHSIASSLRTYTLSKHNTRLRLAEWQQESVEKHKDTTVVKPHASGVSKFGKTKPNCEGITHPYEHDKLHSSLLASKLSKVQSTSKASTSNINSYTNDAERRSCLVEKTPRYGPCSIGQQKRMVPFSSCSIPIKGVIHISNGQQFLNIKDRIGKLEQATAFSLSVRSTNNEQMSRTIMNDKEGHVKFNRHTMAANNIKNEFDTSMAGSSKGKFDPNVGQSKVIASNKCGYKTKNQLINVYNRAKGNAEIRNSGKTGINDIIKFVAGKNSVTFGKKRDKDFENDETKTYNRIIGFAPIHADVSSNIRTHKTHSESRNIDFIDRIDASMDFTSAKKSTILLPGPKTQCEQTCTSIDADSSNSLTGLNPRSNTSNIKERNLMIGHRRINDENPPYFKSQKQSNLSGFNIEGEASLSMEDASNYQRESITCVSENHKVNSIKESTSVFSALSESKENVSSVVSSFSDEVQASISNFSKASIRRQFNNSFGGLDIKKSLTGDANASGILTSSDDDSSGHSVMSERKSRAANVRFSTRNRVTTFQPDNLSGYFDEVDNEASSISGGNRKSSYRQSSRSSQFIDGVGDNNRGSSFSGNNRMSSNRRSSAKSSTMKDSRRSTYMEGDATPSPRLSSPYTSSTMIAEARRSEIAGNDRRSTYRQSRGSTRHSKMGSISRSEYANDDLRSTSRQGSISPRPSRMEGSRISQSAENDRISTIRQSSRSPGLSRLEGSRMSKGVFNDRRSTYRPNSRSSGLSRMEGSRMSQAADNNRRSTYRQSSRSPGLSRMEGSRMIQGVQDDRRSTFRQSRRSTRRSNIDDRRSSQAGDNDKRSQYSSFSRASSRRGTRNSQFVDNNRMPSMATSRKSSISPQGSIINESRMSQYMGGEKSTYRPSSISPYDISTDDIRGSGSIDLTRKSSLKASQRPSSLSRINQIMGDGRMSSYILGSRPSSISRKDGSRVSQFADSARRSSSGKNSRSPCDALWEAERRSELIERERSLSNRRSGSFRKSSMSPGTSGSEDYMINDAIGSARMSSYRQSSRSPGGSRMLDIGGSVYDDGGRMSRMSSYRQDSMGQSISGMGDIRRSQFVDDGRMSRLSSYRQDSMPPSMSGMGEIRGSQFADDGRMSRMSSYRQGSVSPRISGMGDVKDSVFVDDERLSRMSSYKEGSIPQSMSGMGDVTGSVFVDNTGMPRMSSYRQSSISPRVSGMGSIRGTQFIDDDRISRMSNYRQGSMPQNTSVMGDVPGSVFVDNTGMPRMSSYSQGIMSPRKSGIGDIRGTQFVDDGRISPMSFYSQGNRSPGLSLVGSNEFIGNGRMSRIPSYRQGSEIPGLSQSDEFMINDDISGARMSSYRQSGRSSEFSRVEGSKMSQYPDTDRTSRKSSIRQRTRSLGPSRSEEIGVGCGSFEGPLSGTTSFDDVIVSDRLSSKRQSNRHSSLSRTLECKECAAKCRDKSAGIGGEDLVHRSTIKASRERDSFNNSKTSAVLRDANASIAGSRTTRGTLLSSFYKSENNSSGIS